MAENYAIVETGGKQYRAEKGTTLVVDRIKADEGDKVNLRAVMFRGDKADDVVTAGGDLEKVKVEAVVAGHERGRKLRIFKYKAKKGYRKRQGHRSELTRLEVTEVKMLTRKPAGAKAGESKPAEKADEKKPASAKKPEAKKPAAKKPATKKPAAKKPAAEKKAPAKKAPAKKPAAKKTSEKKES
jgi:large subunit ribosomal protein L21